MDQPITRAEYEEFKRRLEEENARQDRRIALLEESVSKMGALSTSVEKLALSMESMVKEQEKQGRRLETLEDRFQCGFLLWGRSLVKSRTNET